MGISTDVLYRLAQSPDCVTINELDNDLPQHARHEIIKTVGTLKARHLAGREVKGCYFATEEGRELARLGKPVKSGPTRPHTGQKKRLKNTLTRRLWKTLRAVKKGTIPELVAMARNDGDGNPQEAAGRILRRWVRGGFVAKLAHRQPGTSPTSNGFIKYYLVRDNGPVEPVFSPSKRTITDGNTGETYTVDGELLNGADQ